MNFNQAPYFDDFDEEKQFYKILFRPGVAVQTREMNQLQSILQNQVTKFGDHVFKEGSMVIPGQVNYNDKLNYIKIASTNLGTTALSDLEGLFIGDAADGSGVTAEVIKAIAATGSDPITLVLLYTSSNESPSGLTDKVFTASSTLYVLDDPTKTLTVLGGSGVSGRSVAAAVQSGVYYLAGHFVTVPSTVISVKKYASTIRDISAKIGIQYTEEIVTADTDSSLYDNANGSPNYAAPGAHRYKINPTFVMLDLDTDAENFFELIRVEDGVLQSIINASQYNILEETLARRTYDESGNYVVDDFTFEVREARLNNRGSWAQDDYLVNDYVTYNGRSFICLQSGTSGASRPAEFATATENTTVSDGSVIWRYSRKPANNRGYDVDGSSSDLVAVFGLGKAYVQGFEISKTTKSAVTIPKARETREENNQTIYTQPGNYTFVDKQYSYGIPDISVGPKVMLFDRYIGNKNINIFGYGNQVGTGRIVWTEPDSRGGIRVGLADIVMNPNKAFGRDVNSIIVPDQTTSITQTSYTLTGLVKYAGNATSSYLAISGTLNADAKTTGTGTITGTSTVFSSELLVGDLLTFGTSSHAVTSAWTITAINNDTTITVIGPPITTAVATTAGLIRIPAQTVFGQAGAAAAPTKFTAEFRVGDRIFMGTANSSTTGTVLAISSDSRMQVSSTLARLIANTSIGTYYAGRTATFGADIFSDYQYGINARKLTGNFSLLSYTGTATTIAVHGAIKITGTNDSRLLTELAVNDLVEISDYRIMITKIATNSVAYGVCLNSTVAGSTTTYPAFRQNADLQETRNNKLLFRVADTAVSSISDNVFTVYKVQSFSGLTGLSSLTLSLAAASGNDAAEQLATTDPAAYFVAQDNISTLSGPITVSAVNSATNQLSIVGTFSSNTAKVIYPVVRAAASAGVMGRLKSKTLQFSVNDTYLTSSSANRTILPLTKTDVYRVVKILMATSFVGTWTTAVESAATDITGRYDVDSGQRDCYYDFGSLKLRTGSPMPTGSIRVYYDYFSHSTGDYFARSSYDSLVVPYENIPNYAGSNLGDVLDFRTSVVSSTGLLASSAPVRFGTNFIADISYYLGRKEQLFLDKAREFFNISGVSDINPEFNKSSDANNAVHLYNLTLKPYTLNANYPNVTQEKFDNRRYTMRDIGRIEKRVGSLEEATALSLLETSTRGLQIRDNLDKTLERYKTGFFVDNFTDASNFDDESDAKFSIDSRQRTMNPYVEYMSFPLVEKINYTPGTTTATELTNAKAARATENYAVTGDNITLKYTTSRLMQQNLATTSISVAPFLSVSFLGHLKLSPDKDIYEDISTNNVIVGTNTVRSLEEAVKAYRATGNWRPYRVSEEVINVFTDSDRTSTLIPWCRANTVVLIGTGLKPKTKHYPFFDGLPVEGYCTGAIKLTFDSMPIIEFEGVRPGVRDEWPRQRALYTSRWVQEVVGRHWVQYSRRSGGYVTDYGNFWRTINPKNYSTALPSSANTDEFQQGLGIGAAVYYYEGGNVVGSGVAVFQGPDTNATTLYIVNGRGKLSNDFLRSAGTYSYTGTFYVSVDGSDPKYLPTTTVTAASAITDDTSGYVYTDSDGVAITLFDLANTDALKYITGVKPVTLSDSSTNDPDNWTSKADAFYTVRGFKTVVTNNYISTRSFSVHPYDPIAQSFKIPSQYANGCFITDIDVFFQGKPVAETAPVTLEIRTCDSTGRPSGTEILPGSTVTKNPRQVSVDATTGATPTNFKFDSPLYLLPDKNYAIVLKADTKNYRIWIATLGGTDVANPSVTHSTQTFFGSLFKSQDGTLWTEDQLSDMKFRINRAVFDTTVTGARVHVVNKNLPNTQLPNNPLTFMYGSKQIRVAHPNHGFSTGDTTRLYSPYWAGQYALNNTTTLNGIPIGEIFGSYVSSDLTSYRPRNTDPRHIISNVTLDTYTITVSSAAVISGGVTGVTTITGGGEDITGHGNSLYQIIKPVADLMNFQPTSISFNARMLRGFTYDNDANSVAKPYTWLNRDLNLNTHNILNTSCIIVTDINEYDRVDSSLSITAGGTAQIWKDSFIGVFTMKSTSDHVSPVINLSSMNMDVVQHRIDNPAVTNRLPNPLPAWGATSTLVVTSIICSGNTTVSFDGNLETINTDTEDLFNSVVPGRYITISGSSVAGNNNTSTGILVTGVSPDGKTIFTTASLTTAAAGSAITIRQFDDYTAETTTRDASGESKFITSKINLENAASQIKLIIEGCIPSAADFDIFYKLGAVGTDFSTLVWKKFVAPRQTSASATSSYVSIAKSDTRGVFTDIEFNISDFDASGNAIDLAPFTAFQIKIAMRSSNAARIPQFRNMRVIAHA